MATTNPVFQVLVTNGNKAPLAKDLQLSDLTPGQIGIFNFHTNVSVDGTDLTNVKDIYLALAVDTDGDGVVDDILKSSGQMIQREHMKEYNAKCYTAPLPKIVDITNFVGKCETTYSLKVEIRNQYTYLLNGYNQVTKAFAIETSCCQTDCETCPQGDCNEVAKKFVAEINADTDGVIKADFLDYTTTPGSPVVVAAADVDDWIADVANEGKCLGVRTTSIPMAVNKFCMVNGSYYNPRSTDILVALGDGFECNGTATTFQELRNEEGLGYDIAQLEYIAGGWNGKPGPYRTSTLAGIPLSGFDSYVTQTAKYTEINLIYDQFSVGGWLEYLNNLNTIIAIPCADTTTSAGLATMLDRIFSNFDAKANDIATCDCTGANGTSAKTKATDGID